MHPFATCLLLAATQLAAVEYVFPNAVELRRDGSCILLANTRDRQELIIVPENIVAVIPANRSFEQDNNNAFNQIIMSGDGTVIKLQQRTNPGQQLVATLAAMGFEFIETVSDRDLRDQERYLLNIRRITLVERKRTESERSDTIVYYVGGTGQTAQFTINQSVAAYERLRQAIAQARH